ncbi:MAG: hypothetical protein RSH52_35490, partial [Janthinobacterium sp.]
LGMGEGRKGGGDGKTDGEWFEHGFLLLGLRPSSDKKGRAGARGPDGPAEITTTGGMQELRDAWTRTHRHPLRHGLHGQLVPGGGKNGRKSKAQHKRHR